MQVLNGGLAQVNIRKVFIALAFRSKHWYILSRHFTYVLLLFVR